MNETIDPSVVERYELSTWNRCAENYLETLAGLTRETIPLLLEAAEITAGGRLLDIGSGPGHVARAFADAGARVTGVDFSGPMIAVARRQYPEITFEEANAEELPFEARSFDAVVSSFVVHHLARPAMVFREVARVLDKGGRFAFTVFGEPEAQSSIGTFFAAVAAHHDLEELPHGPLFGVSEQSVYQPLIEDAGLTDFELAPRKFVWRCDSVEPVVRGFLTWGNIAALPRNVQEKIEKATRENLERYREKDAYAFLHEALLGTARKP